jgi:sulfatase maturation enzyme AslB (radical SAM superfamily)
MNKKNEINEEMRYCTFPFESVEVNFDGKLYFCCSSWQKKSFGNYVKNTMMDEWNSPSAQEIRSSIIDGSYRYCNKDICPYLLGNGLKKYSDLSDVQKKYFSESKIIQSDPPNRLMLNYDQSCNLTCESCRTEKISYNVDSPQFRVLKDLTEKFTKDFFSHANGHKLQLNITGSGDPFASAVFRQFLENLDGEKFPNLIIDLQTNGVLFTPIMWNRLKKIQKNIGQVIVSVDAATEKTYSIVRRGGDWKQLLSNIEFLRSLRAEKKIAYLQVNMIVQNRNYFEMIEFVNLFSKKNLDRINFSLLVDWRTWSKEIFREQEIGRVNHQDHQKFLDILVNPLFEMKNINLGNLTILRKNALQTKYNQLATFSKIKLKIWVYFKAIPLKTVNLFRLIIRRISMIFGTSRFRY